MKDELEIIPYSKETGVSTKWVPGYEIRVSAEVDGSIRVLANEAGLKTLAQHIATLAQPEVPGGRHVHYDEGSGLELGSLPIVIEKSDSSS